METVKQLSVFLENRCGRLDSVLCHLAANGINIIALSLADSADYGMLRMMVSDPEKARLVLKEDGFSAMLTDVICIRVDHATGSLSKAMKCLLDEGVSVDYMYAFANGEDASAVLKCDEPNKALELLSKNHLLVYGPDEAYKSKEKSK